MMTPLTEEQIVSLAESMTAAGIPQTAIANSLNLPVQLIKDIVSNIRIGKYGTDEITEASQLLMWEGLDQALDLMRHGRPADRANFVKSIVGRLMTTTSKQEPESQQKMREELLALAAEQRAIAAKPPTHIYADEYRVQKAALPE